MQKGRLILYKNFVLLLIEILTTILIWYGANYFIYSKINLVVIDNTEAFQNIDGVEVEYRDACNSDSILNTDMQFYKTNIDDVIKVKTGENFKEAMLSYGFNSNDVQNIVNSIPKYFGKINPGQDIFITYNYTGMYIPDILSDQDIQPVQHKLLEQYDPVEIQIRLNRSEEKVIIKRLEDQSFVVNVSKLETEKDTRKVHGYIKTSLYSDALANGVPVAVIHKMLEEYSYDIDFQRDIHENDQFEAIFEEYRDDKSRKVKDGKLLYAALSVHGKWYKMYSFGGNFYNENGQSIKKSLLKTPVDGARISSKFGMRRHPILGYTRAHKGVDFAAPIGTPIYAAGNGVVVFAGRSNGYGNLVTIKHNGEYSTNYAHMLRFASGISHGKPVKQRQVIGYIGMTGLTSGPHLHFELVKHGEKINPTKHTIQSIDKVASGKMSEFKHFVDSINTQIMSVRG